MTVLGLHCCSLFSSCDEQGLLSSCYVWAYHCGGFSCCGAWVVYRARGLQSCGSRLLSTGSIVVAQRLVALWHVGSSRIRDRTCVFCIGMWVHHWTARDVPLGFFMLVSSTDTFHQESFCFDWEVSPSCVATGVFALTFCFDWEVSPSCVATGVLAARQASQSLQDFCRQCSENSNIEVQARGRTVSVVAFED